MTNQISQRIWNQNKNLRNQNMILKNFVSQSNGFNTDLMMLILNKKQIQRNEKKSLNKTE